VSPPRASLSLCFLTFYAYGPAAMMSAAECRIRAANAATLAAALTDGALKDDLLFVSAKWTALAAVADWQDETTASIEARGGAV
jgi:hypothetical protein